MWEWRHTIWRRNFHSSCNCTQLFGKSSKGYNFVVDRHYAEDATEAKGMIPELKVKHANDNAKQHWPKGDSRGRERVAGVLRRA